MADTRDNNGSRARQGRAWWQWALAVVLLGSAAVLAIMNYVPGMRPRVASQVPYREVEIPDELTPADTIPAAPGEFADHNLLIVTFDTTRADRIGCYGFGGVETPMLDRLAHEGVLFSRAIATAPVTLPSHSSIMTGLYPYHHGARANSWLRLDDSNLTLAEVLKDEGYVTGAMVSAFVLDDRFGIGQGFTTFDDEVNDVAEDVTKVVPDRPADQTVDRAEVWLEENADEKFFLWVHFYDPHFPYEPPSQFAGKFAMPYYGEIAFADQQLARLLDIVDAAGVTDETLVVVVGDHGEGLGQHNEDSHSLLIYDSVMHVPMIWWSGDKLGGGAHVSTPVSQVDVMPTALSLLGVDVPDGLDGLDLTTVPPADRPIYVETLEGLVEQGCAALLGVYQGAYKYIYGPNPELYRLDEDPFEQENLVASAAGEAERLNARLVSFFGDDLEKASTTEITETLSPEERAQLEALGYLGAGGGVVPPPAERVDPNQLVIDMRDFNEIRGLLRSDDIRKVLPQLEQFCIEHPKLLMAWQHLARTNTSIGDLAAAEDALKHCLELRSDLPGTHLSLARIAMAQQKPKDGETFFQLALKHSPNNYEALVEFGQLRMAQGRVAEAAEMFETAMRNWPESVAAPELLASAMQAMRRADDGIALLQEQLDERSNLAHVRNAQARLLATQGRTAEAMDVLREGMALSPDVYDLPNNLAYLLTSTEDESLRNPTEAIVIMQRVCDKTLHQHPRYLNTLAMCYATMARLDDAVTFGERAYEIASNSSNPEFKNLAPGIGKSLAAYKKARDSGIPEFGSMIKPHEDDGAETPAPNEDQSDGS